MELREPRPKKHKFSVSQPLPILINKEGALHKFKGNFDGFSVKVRLKDEMDALSKMGCFGKGNFSRGFPAFSPREGEVPFIRKRVFDRRNEWKLKYMQDLRLDKVIVVPDSDDETDYFTNLKAEYAMGANVVQEYLQLSIEEAFFLVSGVGCLNVFKKDIALLAEDKLWESFCSSDDYFVQNYIVYYYFRSKKWVVKPGIKFGGDFLLYKDGPPFYHASYLVIIDILDSGTLERRNDLCRRTMSVINICGLNRLCETVGKELLICQLIWPTDSIICQPQDISKVSINEMIFKRWISSQNRELDDS